MIPTESATQSQQDDRQRILDLLDRQEVIDELGKYGISKVEATARIKSLTDKEVTKIAGRLVELPEGGSSGCQRVIVNGKVVSESSGCDSPDAGVVLAIIGVIILIVLFLYWIFSRNKAEVNSPSSRKEPAPEPVIVVEECDPGYEFCI
jgi:hypothetical protein